MRIERRAQDRAEAALGALFGGVLVFGAGLGAVWLRLGLPRPRCYFRDFTGIPCPSCGSTRLLEALVSGDVVGAAALNPLVFAGVVVVAVWAILSVARLLFPLPAWRLVLTDGERRLLRILAVAALLSGWAYLIWNGR